MIPDPSVKTLRLPLLLESVPMETGHLFKTTFSTTVTTTATADSTAMEASLPPQDPPTFEEGEYPTHPLLIP